MTHEVGVIVVHDRPPTTARPIEEDEGDDEFYTPPVRIRADTPIQICPVCSEPLKKHNALALAECASQTDDDHAVAAVAPPPPPSETNPYDRPGDWFIVHTQIGYEARVTQFLDAREDERIHEVVERKKVFPGYVLLRCDLDDELWRIVRSTSNVQNFVGTAGARPSPLSRTDVDKFLQVAPPAAPVEETGAYGRAITPAVVNEAAPPADVDINDLWTSSEPFPMDEFGDVDYEKLVPLAAAMRIVLERERDEIIRRGGPIEKQNIALKERLATMLEDMQALRRKLQMTAEARNMLQEQVDRQTKEMRKLRNELKGRKESGNLPTRLTEITDILQVVQSAKGWEAKRGGNGHWQFLKDGIFVTDAAGSGGSTKVNMATRVKLRKAGLPV